MFSNDCGSTWRCAADDSGRVSAPLRTRGAGCAGGEFQAANEHVGSSANLLQREPLGIGDNLAGAQLMTDPRAEQLSHHRHDQVPVDTAPAATLKMVPAKLLLGLAKTGFDFPAGKGDSQQLPQRPAAAARNSVADKVFHFAGAHVGRDNQCALSAGKTTGVSFTITEMPPHLPDFRPLVRIAHTVSLWRLLRQAGRILGKVLNLAWFYITGCQTRILLGAAIAISRRFSAAAEQLVVVPLERLEESLERSSAARPAGGRWLRRFCVASPTAAP